jgi:hypothetical protein
MSDFSFFLPITKVDKERRTISGYASTPTLDLDGEIVSLDAVKKALPGYWEWRNIREMHTNSAVGVAKEANVDGTGLFLSAKIIDEDAWQKCLEQVYKGFSIGGKKLAKTGNTITEIDLVEISVVDRPANPDCRFSVNKRRSDGNNNAAAAHLIKAKSPEEKLLRKISKAMDLLAKAQPTPSGTVPKIPSSNPPAARDGFSLPAKVKKSKKCAAHGLKNCAMCVGKVSPATSEVDNDPFRQKKEAKKAKKAAKVQAKELAKQAREKAEAVRREQFANQFFGSRGENSYLELGSRGPDLDLRKSAKPKTEPMSTDYNSELGVNTMDGNGLDQVLDALIKRGKVVTKAQHLAIAKNNLKKARKARMDAIDNIKAAHAMHKTAYLSKAGKPPKFKPADDDADDFDHTGAMEKLGKAYQSLDSMKTFMKAANNHLKKAAGRTGQSGEEVGDSKAPWYTVPQGVHDMSQSELATAGPGGDNHGSSPPAYSMETVYPGKAAKKSAKPNGFISPEHAEALVRMATAEAEANLLKSMPASNGRRPLAFDVSKLAGENGNSEATQQLLSGVDAHGLISEDENARKVAVGKLVGNMIMGGHGRSVFDPSFHGSAGG